jgi:hypothetical protein
VEELLRILLREGEVLEQEIIDRQMATMHERINMEMAAQGRSIGHRGDGEMAHSSSEGTNDSILEVGSLETIHLGANVKIRAKAMEVSGYQQNPAILCMALEGASTKETSLPHHRKPARIGMMIMAEEREMIHIESCKYFTSSRKCTVSTDHSWKEPRFN